MKTRMSFQVLLLLASALLLTDAGFADEQDKTPCIVGITTWMERTKSSLDSSTTGQHEEDERLPILPPEEARDLYNLETAAVQRLYESLDEIADKENLHLFFGYNKDERQTREANVWVVVKVHWDTNYYFSDRWVYYAFERQTFQTFVSSTMLPDFENALRELDIPQDIKEDARAISIRLTLMGFVKRIQEQNLSQENKRALLRARLGHFPTVDEVMKAVRRWRLIQVSQ